MVERVRRGRQATALLLVLAFFFLAIPGTFWLGSPYWSWLGSENVTLEAVMGAFIGSLIAFPVPVGVLLWSRRSAFWDPNRRFPHVSIKRAPSQEDFRIGS